MSEARRPIIFVNPHTHHGYFTCLALSRLGPVQILCPPLLLQIWLGKWKRENLRVGGSCIGNVLATPLALLAFLLYKLKIFSEASYCQWLGMAAGLLASQEKRSLLYVYQDYLLPLVRINRSYPLVVEMIIGSSPAQANYSTTVEALQQASLVMAPCRQILADLPSLRAPVQLAPYGGNKAAYRPKASPLVSRVAPEGSPRSLTIAARAHDRRKGIDILLGALALLQEYFLAEAHQLRVVICGPVSDKVHQRHITSLNQQHPGVQFQIQAGQLRQDAYLQLMQQADLFVMPSRLEGSSPAALEALWMGVPAVLSPQCGVEHFKANGHGRLIEPNTSESLAGILADVLSHPQLLIEWREQLAQDRGLYSWEAYFQAVGQGLSALVKDKLDH